MASKSEKMTQENYDLAKRRGDRFNIEAEQRATNAQNREKWAQDYQGEFYDPMIAGQGGYTPQQAADIQGNYDGLAATDDQLASNQFTQQERNDIEGSPWDRAVYFDKDAMEAQTASDSDRVRGSMGGYRSDLQGALDPYSKSMNEALGDQAGQSIGEAYTAQQQATIGQTGADRRAAVDPALLRADAGALDTIRMSPEEYQQTLTGAGNVVGESYRAAADDSARRARAAGASALGVGAMRDRLERGSAVDRGDAMLKAKIAAGAARAGRAGTAEDFRLRGEESASDRMGRAAMEAGGFEFQNRFGLEDQRLAAEKSKQGARLQVASELGKAGMGVASELGRAGLGVEEAAAQRAQQQRQYGTSLGTEMATGIERDQAARRERNALNRQGIQQSNQAVKYGQGMGVQQAKTRGAQTVADAQRADAAEGRGYVNEAARAAAAEKGQELDRQMNAWQIQGGQQQNATQQQAQQDARPKGWEKAISMGMGAVGAAVPLIGMAQNVGKMATKPAAGGYTDPYGNWGGG
jgi:hypothetical protein